MASQDFASVAAPQKLAGKLCFAQTATMGRFGRAALKPIYELIAKESGATPRSVKGRPRRRAFALPAVAPRWVSSFASQRTGRPRKDLFGRYRSREIS